MSLDVDAPPPPELDVTDEAVDYDDADPGGSEYHRADLQAFLAEGAWERAFGLWAEDADLGETEWAVIRDLDLVQEFDFFWDDFATRVGYHAPGLPEDWREREIHADLESWDSVSGINAGMAELGATVADLLGEEYVDWDTDPDLPDDLPEYE